MTFAACRLMTSSNLVGCSTGRSAAFVPWSSLASCRLITSRQSWMMRGPYQIQPERYHIPSRRCGLMASAESTACWSSSATEENDHAEQRVSHRGRAQVHPMEQRQADRTKATATPKARLVDPDEAPGRGQTSRSGYVQPGYRQQAARLRRGESEGGGRCSARARRRACDGATEEDGQTRQVRADRADL